MIHRRLGMDAKRTRLAEFGRMAPGIGMRMRMAEVQVHGISVLRTLTILTRIPMIYGEESVRKNRHRLHPLPQSRSTALMVATPESPPPTPQSRSPVNGCDPEPPRVSQQTVVNTDEEEGEDEEIVEPVVHLEYFGYEQWYQGKNLVSLPYIRPEWETISDFYDHYNQGGYRSFMTGSTISVYVEGEWLEYTGEDGQEAGNVRLVPYLGFIVDRPYQTLWGAWGVRLMGDDEVELVEGINVLGLTQLPSRYERPSDFLAIDGIESVQVTKWSDLERLSVLLTIESVGDEGDGELYLGQALILTTTSPVTLDMTEAIPSAPMAQRKGTLAILWGAMKVR